VSFIVIIRGHHDNQLRPFSRARSLMHWLGLLLHGAKSGPNTRRHSHQVPRGGRTATRWLTSGTSYLAAADRRLWLGLGATKIIEWLEIRWPSGLVRSWSDLDADRLLEIKEGRDPTVIPTRQPSTELAGPKR
jgi:hypothetical protein